MTPFDAKISDIENKYFTTSVIINLLVKQLIQKNNSDIPGFIDNSDLDRESETRS